MERVLGSQGPDRAEQVVDAIARMDGPEASYELARFAVLWSHNDVAQRAATHLSSRPLDDFAPVLLASLATPVEAQFELLRDQNTGGLIYRQTLVNETEGAVAQDTETVKLTRRGTNRPTPVVGPGTANNPNARGFVPANPAGNPIPLAPDELEAQTRQAATQRRVDDLNRGIDAANSRVFYALEQGTSQSLPRDSKAWWSWWNDTNEVFVEGEKQVLRTARLIDTDAERRRREARERRGNGRRSHDCLAAGTPIWTPNGTRPIETIQPGDLVLSQDPLTGELAYKGVLKQTQRPAAIGVIVELGSESIRTSGGHPFWVAGEGWEKARTLVSGEPFHGIEGPVSVGKVTEDDNLLPTYNLIVADFHSYFVGRIGVLSHDNTARSPTRTSVPGLPLAE